MENIDEINRLLSIQKMLPEAIKDCGVISYTDECIGVSREYRRLSKGLSEIKRIIGDEKFTKLTSKFVLSLHKELFKVAKETEKELSKYQIVKK